MRGCFPVRRSPPLAWAMLVCALTIQPAAAQALPPAVVACMDEHDSTKRLACYDREVPRAVAATPAPAAGSAPNVAASGPTPGSTPAVRSPAPATATSARTGVPAPAPAPQPAETRTGGTPTPSAASEVDAFGMTAQIQRKENGGTPSPRLDKLTARIASVSQKPLGEFIVTLDNGQVWEEAESTSHLPLRAGDDITIKRGMLGAFYMSSHQVLGLRVKRVR